MVIIQPLANGKTGQQRGGEQPAAGRRADEGEARQIQADAAGVGAGINDDVQLEILHRRIKIFLDGLLQAVNFVNKKNVALLQVGEQSGQVAGFFDGGAAGAFDADAHAFGDDVGQGGFAQAGRPAEEKMIQRLAALFGGLDGDFQPFLDIVLAGELGKQGRAQRHFQRGVRLGQHIRNHSIRHAPSMGKRRGSDKE